MELEAPECGILMQFSCVGRIGMVLSGSYNTISLKESWLYDDDTTIKLQQLVISHAEAILMVSRMEFVGPSIGYLFVKFVFFERDNCPIKIYARFLIKCTVKQFSFCFLPKSN